MRAPGGTRLLVVAVCVVVAATVIAAIVIIDPPTQRLQSLDSRRVEDLSSLRERIDQYHERHGAVPPDLATLEREPGLGRLPTDPGSSAPYEYEPRTADTYRLCATFALDAREGDAYRYSGLWAHGAGRFCFDLEIED